MSSLQAQSLNTQLQELSDRQAITELISRLGLMLDQGDFDQAPLILAADVSVKTPGGYSAGLEEVVAQARRNHTVRTQHLISDILVELDGDSAVARSNLVVVFVPDSDQPGARLSIGGSAESGARLTVGERYRFTARRGVDGWRLRSVEVARIWSSQAVPNGALVQEVAVSPSGDGLP